MVTEMPIFKRLMKHKPHVPRRLSPIRHWPAILWLLLPSAALAAPVQPDFSVAEFVTCKNAKMEAPHDWHVPGNRFLTVDSKFFAWLELTNVTGEHVVEMKVYRPDGTYYGKETQSVAQPNGFLYWWRMAAWWRIKDDRVASTPGRWKLGLAIDGVLQRSITFNVVSENSTLAAAGQRGSEPTSTLSNPVAGTVVLESSTDLVNWIPIQTNALPVVLLGETTLPNAAFRLRLQS